MTLSICIPSYNRFEKLNQTVEKILEAKSDDFEVVIIDNCSPRNIDEYIKYDDKRLRIIKREQPVYGVKNVGDSILFGKGKYSLLLLDKDYILGNELDKFISYIKNSGVYGGYCELNSQNDKIKIIHDKTIQEFGFLSKHPSGDFYDMEILRDYMKKMDLILEKDPFPFDIYLAYCASKGTMMHYNSPMVCSALNDPKADDEIGTLTFKKSQGNIYYFPKNRNDEFAVYLSCLSEMNVNKNVKFEVVRTLYKRTIILVSTSYREIMKNPVICKHYHHEQERITVFKMIRNILSLRKVYYKTECKGITKSEKKKIERQIIIKKIKNILNCKGA